MSNGLSFKYDTARKIVNTLKAGGFVTLFAGGCVRDIILNERPKDYDIVTTATPEEVKEMFDKTIDVGEKYGVIKVIVLGTAFEVATFRTDVGYVDGRRPVAVKYAEAHEDARRRDFTINGMFFEPLSGEVIDYVGGRKDLERRLVRAIGDAQERLSEDYLRLLRAVRFASRLGFVIEKETLKAIEANAAGIAKVSGERVRQELEHIFDDSSRRRALEIMEATGLLEHVLPEVAAMRLVPQDPELHPEGDVWQHTLLCMENLKEPSFVLAMGVLLHDVGKPVVASVQGERHFHTHERVGESIVRKVAGRLRLSKRETDAVAFLVRYHLVFKDVKKMKKSTLKRVLGHELFQDLAALHRIDAISSAGDLSNWEFAMTKRAELTQEQLKPKALLNGDDLKAIGVAPGPLMGKLLGRIYTAQLEEEISTRPEALELAARLIAEEPKE